MPEKHGPDWTGSVRAESGYQLHVDSFGNPEHPGLLMVMGGNAPCIAFSDDLCRALTEHGYRVVRYDHRGAGYSDPVDFPDSAYALDDMAADAADVVRTVDLAPAYVYGISTGGAVAQLLALDHPKLVRGLALMSTSPDYNVDPRKPPETGLPLPGQKWVSLVDNLATNVPPDRESTIQAMMDAWRVTLGDGVDFDERYWRTLVENTLELPKNNATAGAHQGPAIDAAPPRTPRLSSITAPTLVIHGGQDDVLPPEHGRALAQAIPNTRLVEVPELGHMFPPSFHHRLVDLLVGHFPLDPGF